MAGTHSRHRMKRRSRRRLERLLETIPEWTDDDLADVSEALARRIRDAMRVKRIVDNARAEKD